MAVAKPLPLLSIHYTTIGLVLTTTSTSFVSWWWCFRLATCLLLGGQTVCSKMQC